MGKALAVEPAQIWKEKANCTKQSSDLNRSTMAYACTYIARTHAHTQLLLHKRFTATLLLSENL